jgi:hypothetical protein
MGYIEIPKNPGEFGRYFAEEFMTSGILDEFHGDESGVVTRLKEVDEMAENLDYYGNDYFVESNRALSIPSLIVKDDEDVSYIRFDNKLTFEGKLITYSSVKIGKIIGGNAVRAFCLTFDDVTLLPYFDSLPDGHLLHVPAYAVEEIDKSGGRN